MGGVCCTRLLAGNGLSVRRVNTGSMFFLLRIAPFFIGRRNLGRGAL